MHFRGVLPEYRSNRVAVLRDRGRPLPFVAQERLVLTVRWWLLMECLLVAWME
ncbi:hypothetical protein D3C85_800290 [compost metagenome]